jgi:hypothetical protein
MNYSYEKFGDELYIKPHRLLHCRALIQPDIQPVWYEGKKYFFESSADSVFPFDPFAASFYLVTRYEEHLRFNGDRYGRFQPEDSILKRYGLMKKPVVDIWARMLEAKFSERFPQLVFARPSFRFLPTIDVDNAWAYAHKGVWRSIGAFSKVIFKGNFSEAGARARVLLGKEKDPYDTYDFLDEVFRGNEDKVVYFFQVGDYSRYDRNISWKNRSFRRLIRDISTRYATGIHPSYASSKKRGKKKLAAEVNRLFKITGIRPEKSRQHYLRLRFPRTYRRLEDQGIKEDYTMGYAAATGFRAGTCTPYYFYDLKRETSTNLKMVPFQVMDGTLNYYMNLKPAEAWKEIESLMEEVKSTGGVFVPVWHNETLAETEQWKGYREVFRRMIQKGFEWANEEQLEIFEPQQH